MLYMISHSGKPEVKVDAVSNALYFISYMVVATFIGGFYWDHLQETNSSLFRISAKLGKNIANF